jgi:hypothetical protein
MQMSLHLRQVALIANELRPVVEDLCGIFDLEVCYIDEEVAAFGLENSLLPVGNNFIEVVAPLKSGTAGGRYLERRGGDGGYMVITQADGLQDQAAHRQRATNLGVRVAWECDHDGGRFMQLHPADTGGAFFEIDSTVANDANGDWPPAGGIGWKKHVRTSVIRKITGVELQSDNPTALAERWASVAAVDIERDENDEAIVRLENAIIRFSTVVDGRGDGLSAIDVVVENKTRLLELAAQRNLTFDEDKVMIGGVRFNLI